MIEADTYISIVFAIIVPVIGGTITIIIKDFSYFKRRDLLLGLYISTFMLLLAATLIYCCNRYFEISDLLPLTKDFFSDPSFSNDYKNIFICSFAIILFCFIMVLAKCGDIRENGSGFVIFDIKCAIITLTFYLFIGVYLHLWFAYILCRLALPYIICMLVSIVLAYIEFGILNFGHTYLTFRKIARKDKTY